MRTYTSPTKISWERMKSRCDNQFDPNYDNYGGRGIFYCSRWVRFKNFLEDMGERPPKTTIERKNPDGNYTKDNCVWADSRTQANNKRNTPYLTVNGITKKIKEWSEETGIKRMTITSRLRMKWEPSECLNPDTTSKKHKCKRAKENNSKAHKGEVNGASFLNSKDVLEIRRLYTTGRYSYSELAELFTVSKGTISHVVTRISWRHI